jgi:hypothetical protein
MRLILGGYIVNMEIQLFMFKTPRGVARVLYK